MKDISTLLDIQLQPIKAFLIYGAPQQEEVYVESYDIDTNGYPINAHPLASEEAIALARSMDSSGDLSRNFLQSKGVIPAHVLHINPTTNGFVLWHTPQQEVNMLFSDGLTIPSGKAFVPALLWKASKDRLAIYALANDRKPTENSTLLHAPFFNIYDDGSVCMGTVDIDISGVTCLEDFIKTWQDYFWNSYFSHANGTQNRTKSNIIQLWQQQIGTSRKFPNGVLIKTGKTLKSIL